MTTFGDEQPRRTCGMSAKAIPVRMTSLWAAGLSPQSRGLVWARGPDPDRSWDCAQPAVNATKISTDIQRHRTNRTQGAPAPMSRLIRQSVSRHSGTRQRLQLGSSMAWTNGVRRRTNGSDDHRCGTYPRPGLGTCPGRFCQHFLEPGPTAGSDRLAYQPRLPGRGWTPPGGRTRTGWTTTSRPR